MDEKDKAIRTAAALWYHERFRQAGQKTVSGEGFDFFDRTLGGVLRSLPNPITREQSEGLYREAWDWMVDDVGEMLFPEPTDEYYND